MKSNIAQDIANELSAQEDGGERQPTGGEQNNNGGAGAGADEDIIIGADDDTRSPAEIEAAAKAAGAGQPDREAIFAEMAGEDSKTVKEKLSKFNQYKEQAEATAYKSPVGKAFDELVSQGIPEDVAIKYIKTDAATLDDVSFAALKLQIEHGISEVDARRKVERDYKIGEFKIDEDSEKDGLLDLKIAMGKERPEFQKLKDQMLAPFKTRESVQKDQQAGERMAQWAPEIPKVVEELKELKLPVGKNEKTGKPLFSIPFKVQDTEILVKEAEIIIKASPGMTNTEEGRAQLKEIMMDRAIKHNLPSILQKAARAGRSEAYAKIEAEHNPTDFKGNESFDMGGRQEKTEDDNIVEAIERAQDKKRK